MGPISIPPTTTIASGRCTWLPIAVEKAAGNRPIAAENPVIKTLWEHIPFPGKEVEVASIKINVMDLIPADHGFYRFPGSLTAPICNEPVQWYLMKNPIEMSEAQINQYRKYYHDTARPLQPLNDRPLVESQ